MSEAQKFNQIPSACIDMGCPLDQAAVDRNGVVLSRHCKGPSWDSDILTTSRVVVEEGEVISDMALANPDIILGGVACRNTGFNQWLDSIRTNEDN